MAEFLRDDVLAADQGDTVRLGASDVTKGVLPGIDEAFAVLGADGTTTLVEKAHHHGVIGAMLCAAFGPGRLRINNTFHEVLIFVWVELTKVLEIRL